MHDGMDGPHLFHIFVKSSDPQTRVSLLKVKADIVPLETWRRSHPQAFYLPRHVADFPLLDEVVGVDALDYASKAFGPHGQERNAYLGRYEKDKQHVQLVISEFTDSEQAKGFFSELATSIKEHAGTSLQYRQLQVEGHPVYVLKNEAHEFFYFQRGNKVAWLFPTDSVAEQSLRAVMQHLQP
jgi:hypothetical protein